MPAPQTDSGEEGAASFCTGQLREQGLGPLPCGAAGKEKDPALSPGLRRQVGHRRGSGARGAIWQRGRMRTGSGGPRAAPGRGQPDTGGGAGPSGCWSGVL